MKMLLLVSCCFFMLNCADEEVEKSSEYLQVNTLKLAQPRLKASGAIIDSSVVLSATFRMKDASIRYTKNGEEPDETSELYNSSLQISEAGIYKFKAFHNDWKPSKSSEIEVFKKGKRPSAIYLQSQASNQYSGKGDITLFNNKKAPLDFQNQQWIGYNTTAMAVVKFKTNTNLEKITIGYLIDTKSWIFPPEKVSVIINEKDSVLVEIPKLAEGQYKSLNSVRIPINKTVETLKIDVINTTLPNWHSGANNKAWLFMDEWIFN